MDALFQRTTMDRMPTSDLASLSYRYGVAVLIRPRYPPYQGNESLEL